MRFIFTLYCLVSIIPLSVFAQDAHVMVQLFNTSGTPHKNIKVVFKRRADGKLFQTISDGKGICKLDLPIAHIYDMTPANAARNYLVKIDNFPGANIEFEYRYDAGIGELDKRYAFTEEEKIQWKSIISHLPDTTRYKPVQNLAADDFFVLMQFILRSLDNKPLQGEYIYITGRASGKTFVAQTDVMGRAKILVPKGDTLDMNFKHDRNFEEFYYPLSTLETRGDFDYAYEGTTQIERKRKEKEIALLAEKKRLEKLEREFKMYIAKESISALEGRKKEMENYISGRTPLASKLLQNIFERNKHWKDKLIVTDLTASMTPYAGELLVWYKLNYTKDQNMQFVFFNDGDQKPDEIKRIGETGGIYYCQSKGVDSILRKMAYVSAMGSGGDVAENNMEALIKGVALCKKPFKELIMIADNQAPVKDIELLSQFKVPVRVILCGVNQEIEPDYLKIAWQTGGSVHTIEEDVIEIARLTDGQEIKINKITYRLMKGRFIAVYKT